MVVNTLAVMTVEISISCVVKVYHHCPFKVKEGRKGKCFPFPRRGENTVTHSKLGVKEASLAISKQILSAHFDHIKWIFAHKYCKPRSKTVC